MAAHGLASAEEKQTVTVEGERVRSFSCEALEHQNLPSGEGITLLRQWRYLHPTLVKAARQNAWKTS
eukprot:2978581-Amphidinium_carterae.4